MNGREKGSLRKTLSSIEEMIDMTAVLSYGFRTMLLELGRILPPDRRKNAQGRSLPRRTRLPHHRQGPRGMRSLPARKINPLGQGRFESEGPHCLLLGNEIGNRPCPSSGIRGRYWRFSTSTRRRSEHLTKRTRNTSRKWWLGSVRFTIGIPPDTRRETS